MEAADWLGLGVLGGFVLVMIGLEVRERLFWRRCAAMRRGERCEGCGYDLRGQPDGPRVQCPECGDSCLRAE